MHSIAPSHKPHHIAVIMDGNGRWAERQGRKRAEGHRAGAESAQKFVENARDAGIAYVTLFVFSAENWKRPAAEVGDLMGLLRHYLKKETAELHKSGARLKVIGDRAALPDDIVKMIVQAEDVTKDNTQITVVIALSYGGRQDIVAGARQLAARAAAGEISPADIDADMFANSLTTAGVPDPDLVIRTSGEARISNFLLYQMAYAEIFFTETLWPDFSADDFKAALDFFAARDRRFGGLKAYKQAGEKSS